MTSKVIGSQPNPDRPRQPLPSPLTDRTRCFGSINMDDLFKNICPDSAGEPGSSAVEVATGNKTAEEIWRDIVTGAAPTADPAMTLEDFLTKAGAVTEEDVMVPAEAMMNPAPGVAPVHFAPYSIEIGNGVAAVNGRGKRRPAVEEVPIDKASQQKQRRMIKNRESAARSRERKQAYTVELESLVSQLEMDNAQLLKEEAKLNKLRYNQLMKNLIPVVEKRGRRRVLRRVQSMEW